MPVFNVIEKIAGTTLKPTWVNSGVTPGSICSTLRDKDETLVGSVTATSSGNGFYYALHQLPNSACWLINEWIAGIATNTYVDRQFVRVVKPEVD